MKVENALTVYQPWAWAMSVPELPMLPGFDPVPPKRIENRTWRPWRSAVGKPLAIHAGLRFDQAGADFMTELGVDLPFKGTKGWPTGILAVAMLAGWMSDDHGDRPYGPSRAAICEDWCNLPGGQLMWYTGPFAWLLKDVRHLDEPIPILGKQGIWKITAEASERIASQRPWREPVNSTGQKAPEPEAREDETSGRLTRADLPGAIPGARS